MRLLLLAVTLAYAHGAIVGVDQCAWGPSYWCSHISHAKACGAVKHCTDTVWRNTIQPKADGEVCQMCEALLKDVDDMLQNQEDQKIIIAYMQKACAVIPVKSLADECNTTVTTYFPEIAGMLAEAIDPVAICGAMNLCPTLQNTVVVDKTKPISKKPTADVQTTDCADCKKFLGDVRAKITSNETKEEIKNYIDQALCQNMGALETLCDQVIENYLDQVLELLASEVDPALICDAIGFCPAVTKQSLIKALLMKTPLHKSLKAAPSEYCLLCHTVFEYLQVMERSKATQEEIEKFIETSLCSKLGQYAAECNQTVEQYAPLLFELISSELDPNEICKMIGFCQTSKMTVPLMLGGEVKPVSITRMTQKPKQVKVKSSTTCVMCEFVMREVDSLLKKNASEAEVTYVLEKVCDVLPSTVKDDCVSFVIEYGKDIISLVTKGLDPQSVCTSIKLCTSTVKAKFRSDVQSGASVECVVCEFIVAELSAVLTKNATEDEIIQAVEKICDILPSTIESTCKSVVIEFGPQLIDYLIRGFDPAKACTQIGVCDGLDSLNKELVMHKSETVDQSVECVLCEFVLKEVDSLLKGNRTEDEIIQAVETVCDILPSSIRDQCKSFIIQYGPQIIDALVQGLDPSQVCKKLGIYSGEQKLKLKASQTIECVLCEFALNEIDSLISTNKTEAEIIQAVENVCDILPGSIRDQCKSFIIQYGPQIIDALAQGLDPSQVCTRLGICSGEQKLEMKVSASIECVLCEFALKEIDSLISTDKTEAEIIQAVENVCDILPGSIRDQCKSFIIQYGPQIIDALIQGLDPSQVCTRLGICSGEQKLELKASQSIECVLCEFALKEIDSLISTNKTEAEIIQAVENVCDILPGSIRDQCKSFIIQYGPQIIYALIQGLDPSQVCTKLGICSDGQKLELKASQSIECILCEFALKEIDSLISTNKTEAEIIQAVENVCDILPGSIRDQCKSFIIQYGPQIIDALIQGLDPSQVCTKLGICSGEQKLELKGSASIECVLCEFALNEIDSLISTNKTEAEIIQAVENVCDILPGSIRDQCKSFIIQYGPQIIDALTQGIDPSQVCTRLGICSGEQKLELKGSASIECVLCEFALNEIDSLISTNKTEAEIIQAVENVCDILPGSIRDQCKSFIIQYGPQIIDALIQGLDPSQVCTKLGICSGEQNLEMKVSASIECVLCEFALKEIDSLISTNKTEAEIIQAVENVCDILPGSIRDQCKSFIIQYGPQIIDALIQGLDPSQVCTKLGICSGEQNLEMKVSASIECVLCEFALKEIDSLISTNKTEAEIIQAVENVCDILPGSIRDQCKSFIIQYGPQIIDALAQGLDPSQVCTKLGICSGEQKLEMNVSASIECVLCEFALKEIDSLISTHKTEAEIIQAVENVCDILPGSIRDQCKSFIIEYGPQIIDALIQGLDPSQVCTKLGICSGEQKVELKASQSIECILCEFALKEIDSLISTNKTEAEAVENVCDILPGSIRDQCKSFIIQYGPQIIDALAQGLDPSQVCTKLGICSGEQKLEMKVSASIECVLCEFALKEIDSLISTNKTEAEIIQAVENVCDILPGSIRDQCKSFIIQYGPQIIDALIQGLDPSQVCTKLGICSGKQKLELKASQSIECFLCEFALKEIDSLISTHKTEAEIIQAVENVCDILPGSIRDQCKSFIIQYGPQIIDALIQGLDPSQVCTKLGICSGEQNLEMKVSASIECVLCEFALKEIDSLICTNKTEAEIIQAVENVCEILPGSIRDQCKSFIIQYGPQIIDALIQGLDPSQVCTTLGICSGEQKRELKVSASIECVLCEFALKEIDSLISTNKTEAEIIQAVENVCDILPGSIRDQCKSFIIQYGPQIIDALIQGLDPSQVCTKLGICSGKQNLEMKVSASIECVLCEFALKEIDSLISTNKTEAEIIQAVENVCDILPGSIRDQCKSFIIQYGPQIIDALIQGLDPSQVCTKLGICSGEQKLELKSSQSIECVLCEFALKEIDSLISTHKTEAEIIQAVENVCDILPGSIRDQCKSFIIQYGPQIIDALIQGLDPSQVCTKLGICSGEQNLEMKVSASIECVLCEFALKEIDSLISTNKTEAEIIQAVENVCDILPGSIRDQCKSFIIQYGPQIIDALIQGLDPSQVCTKLGICSGEQKLELKSSQSIECVLCEFALKEIDSLISTHKTEAEIIQAVENVCDILPGSIRDQCKSFIIQYGPQIIDALIQGLDPSQVCTKLGICSGEQNLEMKVSASIECVLCEFALKEIDSLISTNKTEAEIIQAVENVCEILPGSIRDQCKSFIIQYGPQIIDALIEGLDPSQVCTTLGICSGKQKRELKGSASIECVLCEFALKEIDSLISTNKTEAEIIQAVENVCDILPGSIRDQCKSFIIQYGPQIIDALIQGLDPSQVCTKLGICSGKQNLEMKVSASIECVLCEFALKEIDSLISTNKTEAEIIQAVENVCDILPGSIRDQCKSFIIQYGPQIIDALIQGLDPSQVCSKLGICSDKLVELSTSLVSIDCKLCEVTLKQIDKEILKSNSSGDLIIARIIQACDVLPDRDTVLVCKAFVAAIGPAYIKEVQAGKFKPIELCSKLGFCSNDTSLRSSEAKLELKNPELKTQVGRLFEGTTKQAKKNYLMCNLLVSEMETMIQPGSTVEQYIISAGEICGKIPNTLKPFCQTFFAAFSTEISQNIQNANPEEICAVINDRKNKMRTPIEVKDVQVDATVECIICEFVMMEMDKLITKNSSEQEIVAALDKVCSILPSTISAECKDFVDQYGPAVINLLAQELDPSMVCSTIGLCSSSKKLQLPTVKSSELCGICETVVQYVDSLLEENATVTEIEAVLEKVCNFLPGSLKSECDDLVKQYGPLIISLLQQEIDPPKICGELGLCNNTVSEKLQKVNQPLLGVDECTYGPVFWCKDIKTAKQCNAVAHCSRHVWNN